MISARIAAGALLTLAGVLLIAFVHVAAGVVALVFGVGLLLPFDGGDERDTSWEWSDFRGGGGDGGGGP